MTAFWGDTNVLAIALLFFVGFELACCFARFVLGKKSTQNTGIIGLFTGGIRIHHGYVGILLILVRNLFPAIDLPYGLDLCTLVAGIGWGCVISDGIHHFWVLLPITGHHDFDLVYPKNSFPALKELENTLRDSKDFASFGMLASAMLLVVFIIIPR